MKKLIIFLAVIYFVNSSSPCNSLPEFPENAEVCYNLAVGEDGFTCCYFYYREDSSIAGCRELPINETLREDYIKNNYPEYKSSYDYSCFDSFLKTSLLLIISLILL